jgi:tetratricopeptide (TPR) repeat protein
MADTLNGLAYALLQLGDYAGAEERLRSALVIDRTRRGEDHWTVAYDESSLAAVLHADGRLAEAESMYREALAGYERGKPGAAYVASAQQGLGDVLVDLGRLGEAQAMLSAAEASWRQSSSSADDAALAVTRAWEGRLALAAGRYSDAGRLLTSSLAQLEQSRDPKDLRVRRTQRALVDLYTKTGDNARAEDYRRRLAASEGQIAQLASADCAPGASLR